MNNYFKNDIILLRYPFTDLSVFKVRPAIIVSGTFPSNDIIIVPLTSKFNNLLSGEFVMKHWKESGLNTVTAVKRGLFTIDNRLIIQKIGVALEIDTIALDNSIKYWLALDSTKKSN